MDIVILIGIYCYFGFVLLVESCEVSVSKTQSAINAIQYVRNLPRKNHCETLFAGHTPSSVGFGCKGSEKFAIVQIFQLKVYGLKFIV